MPATAAELELGQRRVGELARPNASSGIEVVMPPRYTPREISSMSRTPPAELKDGEVVPTPAGTWTKKHDIFIFDMKPTEELERITKPESETRLEKIVRIIKAVSMMY